MDDRQPRAGPNPVRILAWLALVAVAAVAVLLCMGIAVSVLQAW